MANVLSSTGQFIGNTLGNVVGGAFDTLGDPGQSLGGLAGFGEATGLGGLFGGLGSSIGGGLAGLGKQIGGGLAGFGEATGLEGAPPADPETARKNLEAALNQLSLPTRTIAPEPITLAAVPTLAAPLGAQLGTPSRFAEKQADLIGLLSTQARGEAGPSPAEQMLAAQQDRNLRQQMALAASLSGRALPAAQRQIQQQQAISAQEALQQAAILRSQEQIQAQQQAASALGQARGQDITRQQAQLQADLVKQQVAQAAEIEQARLTTEQQQFQAAQQLEQQRIAENIRMQQEQLATDVEMEKARQRAALEQVILTGQTAGAQAQETRRAGVLGGVLGAAGEVIASKTGSK